MPSSHLCYSSQIVQPATNHVDSSLSVRVESKDGGQVHERHFENQYAQKVFLEALELVQSLGGRFSIQEAAGDGTYKARKAAGVRKAHPVSRRRMPLRDDQKQLAAA